ncbi:MAG: fumarate reductase/succinate dehydrogenase flavoprotein subunit [Verrucomicrobia bacterium]|nr:fumarate reductase/succinate dehydrogenase flavoprotein subunit [Verrucomicrobiota bacterium]
MKLDSKVPPGPLEQKWERRIRDGRLISPANKRRYEIIVAGAGLAGASAAAALSEQGYQVKAFCYHDSPRRAHSIAAQGGINAAKNYQGDGDSVWRLFYDTVKGGDFRSREANVYRLAEVSMKIIDHCVALGVPFAREYGGLLANRSFGGALVSRTFYTRGQTGQQLLLAAYSSLMKEVARGNVKLLPNHEVLDLVVIDGRARGVVARNLITGEIRRDAADAVILATGGYSNVYYLSTSGRASNATAIWRAYRRGAGFANPSFVQIHPTCIPPLGDYQSKLTLMSESLRNDGRIWVPKKPGDKRPPNEIPEEERDYYLERIYPAYGNLTPRDLASRAAKRVCDDGRGVGPNGLGVYLDFSDAIRRLGVQTIKDRYGNLFDMYREITGENAYETPMRIYPAVHYTIGGLWVDYDLMSTIPGLFVLGEANFSDHGANRLGASALMQGLADGYFILPSTIAGYLADIPHDSRPPTDAPEFAEAEEQVRNRLRKLLSIQGRRTVRDFHARLGKILWEHCGMSRNRSGLEKALQAVAALREEFWQDARVPGDEESLNQSLEDAARVADFLELGELIARDALTREESCGCHFREEYQAEGEGLRNDEKFAHVAVWEFQEDGKTPARHEEPLRYEFVKMAARNYK